MQISGNKVFDKVLSEYPRLAALFYCNKKWDEMSENGLWQELCLCILSSNVPYELAKSAFAHLMERGYLQLEWVAGVPESGKLIADELAKPLYLPKRLNGLYRKYRFPNLRSKNISQAAKIVASRKNWLSELLASSNSEEEVRDILVTNIPGLGLKEASHFLRNIRYSHKLAIVDSHILSFLIKIGAIADNDVRTMTPNLYLRLESRLQEICCRHDLDISVFDMAVWYCMRSE